jgi:hypothetical protein
MNVGYLVHMTSAEKLDYIYNIFRKLSTPEAEEGIALGFQKTPQPEIVYIGECHGHPWYKMTEAGDAGRSPIESNFLAGHLSDLEIRQKKSTDYGDRLKLRIQINCGVQSFSLVSGLSTYFSRALISGLCSLGEDFDFAKTAVGVEALTGDKGKVILPSLYVSPSPGVWTKVKCDASLLSDDTDMTTAVNDVLRPRLKRD